MKLVKSSALTLALILGGSALAVADPATDAKTKAEQESPTTMGAGKGDQGKMPQGQMPATDAESKAQNESSSTMGAGSGDQGADPQKQTPPTDPTTKDMR